MKHGIVNGMSLGRMRYLAGSLRGDSSTREVLACTAEVADTALMRLALDTVGARFGGTAVVARDVVAASLRCVEIAHVTVFATARPERQFDFPNDPRLEVVDHGRAVSSAAARVAWQLAGVGLAARRRRADLLIGLANGGLGGSVPTAVFIQQALPFTPDVLADEPVSTRARMRMVQEVMRVSARRAIGVAVQTMAMREAVAQGLGLDRDRILTFMPPAPEFPAARRVPAVDRVPSGRRVLVVGSTLAYKNLTLARTAAKQAGCTLFITADVSGSSDVVGLPSLSRAELRGAYESCDVLVMPSRCESLGLPLLEGMRLGVPIVAIDRPYAREVCGEAALYAHDAEAMATALRRVLDDRNLRTRLIEAGVERVARLDRAQAYAAMVRTFMHAARRRGVE